jgi:hypothetical protein
MTGLLNRNKDNAETGRSAGIVSATVAAEKLKPLGRLAGTDYAVLDGKEFALSHASYPDSSGLDPRSGELIIATEVEEILSDGGVLRGRRFRRATPVTKGTYAALVAEREARQAALEAKEQPRPVAVQDIFGVVAGRKELMVNLGGKVDASPEAIVASAAFGGKKPGLAYLPGHPAPATARDTVSWWANHGITFRTRPDQRLLVMARGGRLGRAQYDAIVADTRRIWLYLEGTDPMCEAHPERAPHPATRTVAIDVMACAE